MKRLLILTLATVFCASASTTSTAATLIGQPNCATDVGGGPPTMFQGTSSPSVSYVIPSSGVITRWGVNRVGYMSEGLTTALLAERSGNTFTIVAGSAYERAESNVKSEWPTRMPAKTGQYFGVSGYNSSITLCQTNDANDEIRYDGSFDYVGAVFAGIAIPQNQAMVWASLEPDADSDGYGDETQDKCPQSAAYIDACPVLSIGQQLAFKKNTISVLATATVDAQLTATATVKLPKSGKSKARTVTIKGKPAAFKAGKLKTIKLKLPSSVKDALKAKKKLSATVSLTGNGLANTATASAKVKLK